MIGLKSILDDFQLYEAEEDRYVHIGGGVYKEKDGKGQPLPNSPKYIKKDSGGWEMVDDDDPRLKKGDDEKPDTKKGMDIDTGGGFEDDGDESEDEEDMDDDKGASEKENEKIEKELQDIAKDKGLTVGSEDANHGGEIHSLVGKDDDPDNTLGFHAAPNFDNDGNMTDGTQFAIELGMGTSPIWFDDKEEAKVALNKIVDDSTVRDAMDGKGDKTLSDLGSHVKSIVDRDSYKPSPFSQDKIDKVKARQAANDPDDMGPLTKKRKEKEKKKGFLNKMFSKKESITVNGKKYKAIKEEKKSEKHKLQETYERIANRMVT